MNWETLIKEIKFRADRSSGSGGQHVNKVATKVTLSFYPEISLALSAEEKALLVHQLASNISKDGAIAVSEQRYRSQVRNRKFALEKLEGIIIKGLTPPPPARKKIKKKTNTIKQRKAKEKQSEKKAFRRKINVNDL